MNEIKENKYSINTLRLSQNGRHFTEDTFKCIFLNENVSNSIKISLKLDLFLRAQLTIFQHWFRLWFGADQAMMVDGWINDTFMHHSASMS